jgi:hypothetical protein
MDFGSEFDSHREPAQLVRERSDSEKVVGPMSAPIRVNPWLNLFLQSEFGKLKANPL